jgi:trk system potassium uptake protein TrkH
MFDGTGADLATISRDIGSLLAMQAGLMALSTAVAALFVELYVAAAFVVSAGITGLVGLGARRRFADARAPNMKHGMVIAAGGWFATALFGTLPFLLSAHLVPEAVAASYVPAGADYRSSLFYFRNPLHALFEAMSGWTGSGLTMAVHEPTLPRGIQWWRSLIQYVGGVGVIVLTVSILSRPGSGSYALFRSEAREEKIHPSVVSTVRTVWKIFVGYSVLAFLVLFVAIFRAAPDLPLGEVGWQALNHAMTGLATGGFSVTDNSIATYNSPLVEGVLLPIMALGAIAFPVHYVVLRDRELGELIRDLQTRWLLVLFVVGSVALSVQNLGLLTDAFEGAWVGVPALGLSPEQVDAVRDSTFQFVSALSCTGFQSAPIGAWSAGGKLLVSGAMVLGGAAGSTVGGIKIIRGYTIAKGIRWQFGRVFLPRQTVVTARVGDRVLDRNQMEAEFSEAAIVSLLWLILLAASSLVLVNTLGPDFTYADAFFEVASAQGNVGLSAGITGPSMHPVAEGMFVLSMWIGRLEIIPVLAFLRAAVWGLNP